VWAAFFVPALLTRWLGTRGWLALFAGAGAVILAVGLSGGIAWDLPLIGRLELSLDRVYTPMTGAFEFIAQQDVLRPLLVHFFVFDTWHLLLLAVYVALVLQIVQAADSRRTLEPWQRAALAWVLSAVAGFYLLFFWTPAAEWVRLGTSVNRILLHFAPALVFWLQCLWVMRREPQTGAR
jgi:hypothetical protein